jgi:Spy/CpxP family protein refolding chaperone
MAALAGQPAWADPPMGDPHSKGDYERGKGDGHGKGYDKGSEKDGHDGGYGHGRGRMGMLHGSTTHLLRHMLKHETDIGLNADQVAKLKDMQLNLDKTRIKTEADIMILQREIKALVEDEKSDLGGIESKLKQSEDLEVGLRMAAIKTRRDAMSLLTPEQREKEKAIHDKMMQEHKGMMGGASEGRPDAKKDQGKRD